MNEKNNLLAEIEGTVSGHRDGHGFVTRDDGQADIYLPSNEMRAVLHKDRVKVRVVRYDRKGRPEGRVLEIIERRKSPIIGRLLFEGGVWLVAPEDKRYGQDILVPKNATAKAQPGQVVAVELTEPPSLYSQPVGRVTEVLGCVPDQVVANGVGVPVGPGQQVLDAVGGRVAQVLGELPAVLPLGAAEQPADVPDRSASRLAASEVAADPPADRLNLFRPRDHLRRGRSS